MKENAESRYFIKSVVEKYMSCIEEIINIPKLLECLDSVIKKGNLKEVTQEIILQSKVEFNIIEDDKDEDLEDDS
ncbi:hypothetical protein AUJ63_01020 [Candidatus Pacearchaeota archaeon CG1_02_35_32]|nr:MAG: hypothetical protein AUJ63_01020 [Candidatus Pacearchaeota archaeon CG1_02_35_32]